MKGITERQAEQFLINKNCVIIQILYCFVFSNVEKTFCIKGTVF